MGTKIFHEVPIISMKIFHRPGFFHGDGLLLIIRGEINVGGYRKFGSFIPSVYAITAGSDITHCLQILRIMASHVCDYPVMEGGL